MSENNGDKNALPTEPIKIADWLIDRQMEKASKLIYESPEKRKEKVIETLRETAEHLLVFCGRK